MIIIYTVYLVDDDEMLLDEIIETIPWQENGFVVIGSNNDPEFAIDEIINLCPHVVFSDLKMPKMDGLSLVSALKEKGQSCEYVMISAYSTFADTRSFFVMKGFDYILKPINPNDIQIVLERLGKRLMQKLGPVPAFDELTTLSPNFNEMIAFISQNFDKKMTLEKLGKQFGINANYICNLFAKNYGTTYSRFITTLRMKEAKRLIGTTKKALKEIAVDCGYSNYWYFFKVFKEYYGISPTRFRDEENAMQQEYMP